MAERVVSVDDAIAFLNELIELDHHAISCLVTTHCICNKHLAEHPTTQVKKISDGHTVGMLGILNGLFGTDERGIGYITCVYDENNKLIEAIRTDRSSYP